MSVYVFHTEVYIVLIAFAPRNQYTCITGRRIHVTGPHTRSACPLLYGVPIQLASEFVTQPTTFAFRNESWSRWSGAGVSDPSGTERTQPPGGVVSGARARRVRRSRPAAWLVGDPPHPRRCRRRPAVSHSSALELAEQRGQIAAVLAILGPNTKCMPRAGIERANAYCRGLCCTAWSVFVLLFLH
jgi:hypothetical protein